MKRIDVNVDIGEGFAFDADLLAYATSANVCCGEHAGSWELTARTVEACRRVGVRIGAHPGYPDRRTMGRRRAHADDWPAYQTSVLAQTERFIREWAPRYVKPHGAFYNDATESGPAWDALLEVLFHTRTALMGLPNTEHETCAARAGVEFIREGFADRAYTPDGRLVPRHEDGAVLSAPRDVAAQVLRLANDVDSICIHGDTPNCLEFARLVRRTLESAGYEVGA